LSAKKVSDRTPQELKVVSGHFLTLSGTRDMDQLTGAKSSDFFYPIQDQFFHLPATVIFFHRVWVGT
jgi:hypothetical protein